MRNVSEVNMKKEFVLTVERKKEKKKKYMPKAQYKQLLATCVSNLQNDFSSHQSNAHQQRVYKL